MHAERLKQRKLDPLLGVPYQSRTRRGWIRQPNFTRENNHDD